MLKDDADVNANQTAAVYSAWQSVVEQIRDNPNQVENFLHLARHRSGHADRLSALKLVDETETYPVSTHLAYLRMKEDVCKNYKALNYSPFEMKHISLYAAPSRPFTVDGDKLYTWDGLEITVWNYDVNSKDFCLGLKTFDLTERTNPQAKITNVVAFGDVLFVSTDKNIVIYSESVNTSEIAKLIAEHCKVQDGCRFFKNKDTLFHRSDQLVWFKIEDLLTAKDDIQVWKMSFPAELLEYELHFSNNNTLML